MELHFRETSKKRNEMVAAIAQELDIKAIYKGMPSAAYEIGSYTVNRDGSLSFADDVSMDESSRVVDACVMAGFEPIEWDMNTEPKETEADEDVSFTISMPKSSFTDLAINNLLQMVNANSSLIKKAIGATMLPIMVDDEQVTFNWFDVDPDPDINRVYVDFIAKLCAAAKQSKRVNGKEKSVDNEKYAFRCFLLRLGFIGNEYKLHRKILLRNLTGSSAFRHGAPAKKEVTNEISQ